MKKLRLFTLLLFLFTIKAFSYASLATENSNTLPQEKIYVHYNSNFLLVGEKLFYKIYCVNKTTNEPSEYSKVAYIEIIDHQNKSIVVQKVKLENGIGSSDIFLNSTIKTGTYKLIAYTQWMKNSSSFYQENIYIINSFSDRLKVNDTLVSSKEPNNSKISNYLTTKKNYKKREQVILSPNENLAILKGSFSISVKKTNNFIFEKTSSNLFLSKNSPEKNIHLTYIPELRGSLIEGKITAKDNIQEIANVKIGLSTGNRKTTQISTTNNKGEFFFNVKDLESSTILLQILKENREGYDITVKKHQTPQKTATNLPEIIINKQLEKDIKERSLYLQVENAYNEIKQDSATSNSSSFPFFNNLKTVVKLDDYKRFANVKEVIVEILKDVWYTKEQDKYKVHVRDSKMNTITTIPTLLIIDGIIVYDHTQFFDMDAKKINTISIVKDKYIFGGNIYQGILMVNTFDNSFTPDYNFVKEFDVLQQQPNKEHFFQAYENNELKRIPDFRTQLYWNPNIKLGKNITFYTSDISGNYKIEIEGFTKEGQPVSLTDYFTVE